MSLMVAFPGYLNYCIAGGRKARYWGRGTMLPGRLSAGAIKSEASGILDVLFQSVLRLFCTIGKASARHDE